MGQLTMESRERVRRAVTFDHPDRIPLDLWILPGISQRYDAQLDKLLVEYPLDFLHRSTFSPLYVEKEETSKKGSDEPDVG